MSALIDNIRRLADLIKKETKSGGNTAARIGGLFEEIAAELEVKYDQREVDNLMNGHDGDPEAHAIIREVINEALDNLSREKLDKAGEGKDVAVTFTEATVRDNVISEEKLSALFGKVRKWFADLKAVAFSGKASDLTDDENHRLVTDAEKTGWDDKYTKNQTDTKDAAGLKAAKDYTDSLSDNVYKKSETYVRTEIDDKDAATLRSAKDYTDTLSGNVYKKTDTYNRTDIDSKDAAALQAAKNYAAQKVAEVVNSAPGTLDTLQELAAALGNDPNFATSIMALIGGKADSVHKHTKSQITDFPTSMPASDVHAWAKQPTKPAYSAAEVGAAPSGHNHDGTYQPAGNYAPVNHNHDGTYAAAGHNHDGTYQPAGNYAAAAHGHTADQISDTSTKVMMTAAERSKLAGLEQSKVTVITSNYTIKEGGKYIIGDIEGMSSKVILSFSFPENLTTIVELVGNDSVSATLKELSPANGMAIFDIDDKVWKTKINGFFCFNGTLSVLNGRPEFFTGIGRPG